MRTFGCTCGEILYYDNTQCETCGSDVGYCPMCRQVVALRHHELGGYLCSNATCGATLTKCYNYDVEHVCNHCIATPAGQAPRENLCNCCRYNHTIPALDKEGNREKWQRLEIAKRRVFYQLDLLGLPRGNEADGFPLPLSFEFKETPDPSTTPGTTDMLDDHEVVMTGHHNGKITINIHEADPVERERLRVAFNETNRSLIGHFRHELAHYYWDLLIKDKQEDTCRTIFGDHNNPSYSDALERYYQQGPPDDWALNYASAYASMHPWEDFAETFTTYLEMVGTLDTARNMNLGGPGVYTDFDAMIAAYQKLGSAINEMNRTMGLKDLLSRPLVPPVVEKMRYIHQLIRNCQIPMQGTPSFS